MVARQAGNRVTTPSESTGRSEWPQLTSFSQRKGMDIVRAALDVPDDKRSQFVRDACGDDAALRTFVTSLLAATDRSDEFLEHPPVLSAEIIAEHKSAPAKNLEAVLAEALGDRFVLTRELEGGGMSRIFLADEPALGRQVAVKVLSPELAQSVSTERFEREVWFTARLQHPNIVPVITTGWAGDLPYYVMLFVRGESLRVRLGKGVIPLGEALGMLRDIAKALAFAHIEGVVHRDIKPENVLLSAGTAVVSDFGIAKIVKLPASGQEGSATGVKAHESITREGRSPATPGYASPEQALSEAIDVRSDIYSFGVLAYEMLAGEHPFQGRSEPGAMIKAHIVDTPAPITTRRSGLPPRLAALVMRCMAKSREQRFSNGAELLAELESVDLNAPRHEPSHAGGVRNAVVTAATKIRATARPSIAVLPLMNLSEEPNGDSFSDGITAEITGALTRVHGLDVAAFASVYAFKSSRVSPNEIARELGVATLLAGTIFRSGSRVRIRVELMNAAERLILWTQVYARELSDIFVVQDEIASAIATALLPTLTSFATRENVLAGEHRTPPAALNYEAFEHYLRGRQLVELRGDGMREAVNSFNESIRIDPNFAPAHAGMAYGLNLFGLYHAMPADDAFRQARDAADRALELDPKDPLAFVMRAHTALWFEWDIAGAEWRARRALELAPSLYLAHNCLGFVLAAQGRFDESIEAMQNARKRDPLKDYATYDLGWVMLLAGRLQDAIQELESAVERHRESSEMHRVYGYSLFYSGRRSEALAEFRQVCALDEANQWGPANLAQALATCGATSEARALVADIENRAAKQPMPLVGLAVAHHSLGNEDAALDWLERAIDARDYWLIMLRHDPSMAELRGHPRYESLMKRVRAKPGYDG